MSGVVKELVQAILEKPHEHDWTLQGLGMLRMYLSKERRLHVWDSQFAVDNVSEMHTHPWDFKSLVVAGKIRNYKYIEVPSDSNAYEYHRQQIHCGEGGGLIGEPTTVQLEKLPEQIFVEKESYEEYADEIHISRPHDGTVTIVKRIFKDDIDHAFVYWKDGDWVSAEPRKATYEEIETITQYSLNTWFV